MSNPQEAPGAPENTPENAPDPEQNAPESTPADVEPPAPTDPAADENDTDPRIAKAGKEAARYRRELRATETERDALAGRIDRMDRADFERQAVAAGVLDPHDLELVTDLAKMRDENGDLSPDLVKAHLRAVQKDRPHWFSPTHTIVPGGPQGGPPAPSAQSMASLLRGGKARTR